MRIDMTKRTRRMGTSPGPKRLGVLLIPLLLAALQVPSASLVCCIHSDGSLVLELSDGNGHCDPAQHPTDHQFQTGNEIHHCHDILLASGLAGLTRASAAASGIAPAAGAAIPLAQPTSGHSPARLPARSSFSPSPPVIRC
jgi:hypothetical protein